jgi:hypothetical protein
MFEKLINLRIGRPSLINDNEIEVEPPDEGKGASSPSELAGPLFYFSNQVKLIRIECNICNELYSARAIRKSRQQRLKLISHFDNELRKWREDLPTNIQPEKPILCKQDHVHHAVMLHFAYYNCVATLHRLSLYNSLSLDTESEANIPVSDDANIHPNAFSSHLTCLHAARNTAKLLYNLERNSFLPLDNMMR